MRASFPRSKEYLHWCVVTEEFKVEGKRVFSDPEIILLINNNYLLGGSVFISTVRLDDFRDIILLLRPPNDVAFWDYEARG